MPGFSPSELSLDDVRLLLACAEHSKLSLAAKALDVAKSTASRKLEKLEEKLGQPLFVRDASGLDPTALTNAILPAAKELDKKWREFERKLSVGNDANPTIRVAIPEGLASFWLLRRLPEYFKEHPETMLEIDVHESSAATQRREADFTIRGSPAKEASFISRCLGRIELSPYVHSSIFVEDVREMRWLYYEDETHTQKEIEWIEHCVSPKRVMRLSQRNALFSACEAGLGVALIPPVFAEAAGLKRVQGLPKIPHRELFLAYPETLRNVERFSTLRDWIVGVAADTFPQ